MQRRPAPQVVVFYKNRKLLFLEQGYSQVKTQLDHATIISRHYHVKFLRWNSVENGYHHSDSYVVCNHCNAYYKEAKMKKKKLNLSFFAETKNGGRVHFIKNIEPLG